MEASLHIYREDGKLCFPPDGDDPPSYFSDLSFSYAELYVDLRRPELVAYVPAQFTLARGDRPENLFFHYRPSDPDRLFEEFYHILTSNNEELNQGERLSTVVSNGTGDIREQNGVPASLTGAGLFTDEGWSLNEDKHESRVPQALFYAEPGVPVDSRLRREALEELLQRQPRRTLRFGFEDYEPSLQVLQYLYQNDIDVRVLLSAGEGTASMSNVDIFLDPGQSQNFEPLGATEDIVTRVFEEKRSNWKKSQKAQMERAIDSLFDHGEEYEVYNDISELLRYIDEGRSVDCYTDAARDVRVTYDEIKSDPELDSSDKRDIIDIAYNKLEDERWEREERIKDQELDDFKNILDDFRDNRITRLEDELELYRDYTTVKRLLAGEPTPRLREADDTLQRFGDELREFRAREVTNEPLINHIEEQLEEEVKHRRENLTVSLRGRTEQICSDAINRASEEVETGEKRLEAIRTMLENITESSPQEELEFHPEVCRLYEFGDRLESEKYDQKLVKTLLLRARKEFSESLRDEHFDIIDGKLTGYLSEDSRNGEFLNHLTQVLSAEVSAETPELDDEKPQQILDRVTEALNDDDLLDKHVDSLREDIRNRLNEFSDSRKEMYKQRIRACINDVEDDFPRRSDSQEEIYNQMLRVLDSIDGFSGSRYDQVEEFHSVWEEIKEDPHINRRWRGDHQREVRNELHEYRSNAQMQSDGGSMQSGHEQSHTRPNGYRDDTKLSDSDSSGFPPSISQKSKFIIVLLFATIMFVTGVILLSEYFNLINITLSLSNAEVTPG
jgi:hypothetical protein